MSRTLVDLANVTPYKISIFKQDPPQPQYVLARLFLYTHYGLERPPCNGPLRGHLTFKQIFHDKSRLLQSQQMSPGLMNYILIKCNLNHPLLKQLNLKESPNMHGFHSRS